MSATQEITIRPAELSDLHALVEVNHQVWHATYDSVYPQNFVDIQTPSSMRDAWSDILERPDPSKGWFVAMSNDRIVGYAGAGRAPDTALGHDAELYSIFVRPNMQGQGVGARLLSAVADYLTQLSCASLMVWIPEENPFSKFYLKQGADQLESRLEVDYGGTTVPVIAFGWKDLEKLKIA